MTGRLMCLGLIVVTMWAAACDSSSPGTPENPADPFAGAWSGPITDQGSASGTLRFELAAGPAGAVSGTWTAAFANPANNNGGAVTSTVALPPPLVFTAQCTQSGRGIAAFTMTATDNRTLTGSYDGIACNGLLRGTAVLTKQ
jgi:hypothetical protein